MRRYFNILENTRLFEGIGRDGLDTTLTCLGCSIRSYGRDSIVLHAGDPTDSLGILLSGSAQILKDDAFGVRSIYDSLVPGDIFGEALACAGLSSSPVSVISMLSCEVMFVQINKITSPCSQVCSYHKKLLENLLGLLAHKNLLLNSRITTLSQRTTREKIMTYMALQIERTGKYRFEIPFNRAGLADFLCVDRSALSRELSKMREDGVIDFHKNSFEVKAPS